MGNLQWGLAVTIYALMIVLVMVGIAWVLTRHRHRWGTWEDYEAITTRGGKVYMQVKTCKDRQCGFKKSRRYMT